MENVDKIVYNGGAQRDGKRPRYRDIPGDFLYRMAMAYTRGSHRYDPNAWTKNWQSGDLEFALDAVDHAIEHLIAYKEHIALNLRAEPHDYSEDHLANCAANLGMLAWFEAHGYFVPIEEDELNPGEDNLMPVEPQEPEMEPESTWLDKTLKALGIQN